MIICLTLKWFQVLENGWWLGCKDKTVGWFPGTYVEVTVATELEKKSCLTSKQE